MSTVGSEQGSERVSEQAGILYSLSGSLAPWLPPLIDKHMFHVKHTESRDVVLAIDNEGVFAYDTNRNAVLSAEFCGSWVRTSVLKLT
jgi:hypothetical protein